MVASRRKEMEERREEAMLLELVPEKQGGGTVETSKQLFGRGR